MNKHGLEFKRNLLYAGLTENEYSQIKHEISENNKQNVMAFSALASVFLAFLFVLSFFLDIAEDNRWLYGSMLCAVLAIFLIVRYCVLNEKLTWVCVYVFCGLFFGLGIILGTVATPDMTAVTFIAMLLTGPLLFTDRPIRMVCSTYFYVAIFIVMALIFKDPVVRLKDIIHVCLFGSISVAIGFHMTKWKCQRYMLEHKVKELSETDLLTGLKNRNSFEMNKNTYPYLCKESVGCIFIDANGLHELNNAKGHEEGDNMLRVIAAGLKQRFGAENVYRIGGDEFVAFSIDNNAEIIEEDLCGIRRSAELNRYCFSVGYDIQLIGEIDIDSLIKNAEKRMYEDKERYYDSIENTETARLKLRKTNSFFSDLS